ncbi:Alpha/Beta hydrolase protein [Sporodiniella umbellata]|nr:Alpha/Beta hydrolase protein [Sporodiniella umbellata]
MASYFYTESTDNYRALDFYTTPEANEKTPLVVFIHGGAWRSEDKEDYKKLTTECLSLNISVVSVNYRLSLIKEGESTPRIQHPTHIKDVAAAVRFLTQTPPNRQYDSQQIYLVGHSAGAHIALMLLLDDQFCCTSLIRGVMGISGIYDIPLLLSTFPSYIDFIKQAFGAADYHQASPINHRPSSIKAKIIIAHSQQDSLIDCQQALTMTKYLQSLHFDTKLDMDLKGDHYELMNFDTLSVLLQNLLNH